MILALVCVPAVRAEEAALVLPEQPVTVEAGVVSAPDAVTQLQVDCAQLQQEANKHLRTTKIAGSVCAVSSALTVLGLTRWGLMKVAMMDMQKLPKWVQAFNYNYYVPAETSIHRLIVCDNTEKGDRAGTALALSVVCLPFIAGVPAVASGVVIAVQYKKYKQAKQALAAKQAELAKLLVSQDLVAAEQGDETAVL
jgi:hypothetical protein